MIRSINQFLSPLTQRVQANRKWISLFLYGATLSLISITLLGALFPSLVSFDILDSKWIKESGELALNLLWILLWIPIFARVFSLKMVQALLPLRKELGILMGTLAFIHWSLYIVPYFEELSTRWFWISNGFLSYLAFWFFALLITVPLTLTSNTWSMKYLGKYWKYLHRWAYLIAILVVTHVVVLKWYLGFEFIPVIILWVYFICKILEWKGYSFSESRASTPVKKWQKWICIPCGYIYDPAIWDEDSGIAPGTEFQDIPDTWSCPLCWVKKSDFTPYDESKETPTQTARVIEKKSLNPTTIEFTIETEGAIQSIPGQFMSFLWKDQAGTFPRSYSIAKQDGKRYTFLIKLAEKWRGADCLRAIEVWDIVYIRNVAWKFLLKSSTNTKIFIATGTWLAPIYRMIVADNLLQNPSKKSLYFTVSTQEDLFYADELKEVKNLDLHIHISRETVEWYHTWRVDISQIEADASSEWYLCGNPKMVDDARTKLSERWFTKIYSEEFS